MAEINSVVKCGWVAVDMRLGHSAVIETTVPESASQVLTSATYQPYGTGQGTASVRLNAIRQVPILPALGEESLSVEKWDKHVHLYCPMWTCSACGCTCVGGSHAHLQPAVVHTVCLCIYVRVWSNQGMENPLRISGKSDLFRPKKPFTEAGYLPPSQTVGSNICKVTTPVVFPWKRL